VFFYGVGGGEGGGGGGGEGGWSVSMLARRNYSDKGGHAGGRAGGTQTNGQGRATHTQKKAHRSACVPGPARPARAVGRRAAACRPPAARAPLGPRWSCS